MQISASSSLPKAQSLLDQAGSLSTLEGVARWRQLAEECITKLLTEAETLDASTQDLQQQASQLRTEMKGKSFLGHFFKSSDEKQVASALANSAAAAKSCRAIAEKLQSNIDDMPSTEAEKAEMLKELKMQKKELQLEKRELNAQMKGIRTEARQRSVKAATSLTTLIVGSKYTAAERRNIRATKERELAPHEDAKAALERQLLLVDREIMRIESYS